MKEIIMIIIILFIIFSGAFLTQKYLNNTSDELVGKLEDLKMDVKNKVIEEIFLKEKSDKIYEKWKEIDSKWSIIVLHEEIDLIDTALIRMKSKIETGKIEESIEDIETSIFLLNHIKEKEKTSLKNIF